MPPPCISDPSLEISDPTKIQLSMRGPTRLESTVSDPLRADTKHLGPVTQNFSIDKNSNFQYQRQLTSSLPSLTLLVPTQCILSPSLQISDSTKIQPSPTAPTRLESPPTLTLQQPAQSTIQPSLIFPLGPKSNFHHHHRQLPSSTRSQTLQRPTPYTISRSIHLSTPLASKHLISLWGLGL